MSEQLETFPAEETPEEAIESLPRRVPTLTPRKRPVPLGGFIARTRRRLVRANHHLRSDIMGKLAETGALADVARAAEKYRKRRFGDPDGNGTKELGDRRRGPIGRGGMPLGEDHFEELVAIFELDSMRAFSQLIRDDLQAFKLEVGGVLEDDYLEFYNAGGQAARRILGVRGSFNLRNGFIIDALEERANLLSGGLGDEIFDRIRTIVAEEFYLNGQGVDGVAKAIRGDFSFFDKTRSELIAHQETLTVTSQAQQTVYEASGVELKRWGTTKDGRQRFAHDGAHGQIVLIDEPFILVDEDDEVYEVMMPGDPEADIKMTARCRCFHQPIVSESQVLSTDDVWRGDLAPDEFSKERIRERQQEGEADGED